MNQRASDHHQREGQQILDQGVEPHARNQVCEQREDSDRGQAQDPADDSHDDGVAGADKVEYGPCGVSRLHQSDAEQDREHDDRQDPSLGEGCEGVVQDLEDRA